MSSTAFGKYFAIMKWIRCNVSLILDKMIDSEREVVCLIARISLSIEDELDNSGTDIRVEERWLTKIKEIFFVTWVDGSEAMRYWRKVFLIDHNLFSDFSSGPSYKWLSLRSHGCQSRNLKCARVQLKFFMTRMTIQSIVGNWAIVMSSLN